MKIIMKKKFVGLSYFLWMISNIYNKSVKSDNEWLRRREKSTGIEKWSILRWCWFFFTGGWYCCLRGLVCVAELVVAAILSDRNNDLEWFASVDDDIRATLLFLLLWFDDVVDDDDVCGGDEEEEEEDDCVDVVEMTECGDTWLADTVGELLLCCIGNDDSHAKDNSCGRRCGSDGTITISIFDIL